MPLLWATALTPAARLLCPPASPTFSALLHLRRQFSPDRNEMRKQLEHAWPIHSYPLVVMTPDGGVAVAAGKSLVRGAGLGAGASARSLRQPRAPAAAMRGPCPPAARDSVAAPPGQRDRHRNLAPPPLPARAPQVKYARSGATTFRKSWDWPDRPSAPWNYPQTGIGTVLPMRPPYDRCAAARRELSHAESLESRSWRWRPARRPPRSHGCRCLPHPAPPHPPRRPPDRSMFLLVTGGSLKDKAKAITPNDPKSLYNDPQRTASNLAHVIEASAGRGAAAGRPTAARRGAARAACPRPALATQTQHIAPRPPPPAAADRPQRRLEERGPHALQARAGRRRAGLRRRRLLCGRRRGRHRGLVPHQDHVRQGGAPWGAGFRVVVAERRGTHLRAGGCQKSSGHAPPCPPTASRRRHARRRARSPTHPPTRLPAGQAAGTSRQLAARPTAHQLVTHPPARPRAAGTSTRAARRTSARRSAPTCGRRSTSPPPLCPATTRSPTVRGGPAEEPAAERTPHRALRSRACGSPGGFALPERVGVGPRLAAQHAPAPPPPPARAAHPSPPAARPARRPQASGAARAAWLP